MRLSVASRFAIVASAGLFLALPSARASSSSDELLDPAALADLEARAEHAQAREQAFLYTELVHNYVEVAGKQLAAGEVDEAKVSLTRVQTFAELVHKGLAKDTKRVKNAEMLLHATTFHLSQFVHMISSEDEAWVQATLKKLDKLHDELLAQVFAH